MADVCRLVEAGSRGCRRTIYTRRMSIVVLAFVEPCQRSTVQRPSWPLAEKGRLRSTKTIPLCDSVSGSSPVSLGSPLFRKVLHSTPMKMNRVEIVTFLGAIYCATAFSCYSAIPPSSNVLGEAAGSDAPVRLSVFEVSSQKDTGYVASSAMSSARTNEQL